MGYGYVLRKGRRADAVAAFADPELEVFPRGTGPSSPRLDSRGAALALASCAQPTANYPLKGDVKPHANVARAHKLPMHGIDVSRWQGKIDWASVKSAGTQVRLHQGDRGRRPYSIRASSRTGTAPPRPASPAAPTISCTGAGRRTSRRPGSAATSRTTPRRCRRCSTSNGTATRAPARRSCRARPRSRRSG